jgi:hypothetical protein
MLIDLTEEAAPQEAPSQSSALSLAQVRAKIAENSEFQANFRDLPGGYNLEFRICTRQYHDCLGTKTKVGMYKAEKDDPKAKRFAVWACLSSRPRTGNMTRVSYAWHLGNKFYDIVGDSLKNIDFFEPFKHIPSPEKNHNLEKLRFLILFYFLDGGHINKLEFQARGFETFRIAVKQATGHSLPGRKTAPLVVPSPMLPRLTTSARSLAKSRSNVVGHPATHGARPYEAVSITTTTADTTRRHKRGRVNNEASERKHIPFPRPYVSLIKPGHSKRPVIEGLQHLENFVQQIRQPIDTENEKLQAENVKLKSVYVAMKQKRDEWENNARYVQEQLKASEEEHHAITVKLEDLERLSKTDRRNLEATKLQLQTSECDRIRLVQLVDLHSSKEKADLESRNNWVRERAEMAKELEQLRKFDIQIRQLTASRKDTHSTM